MSNTRLQQQLAGQPKATQDEIISIKADARPLALRIALLIPILAGLIGLLNAFRIVADAGAGPGQRRRGDGLRLIAPPSLPTTRTQPGGGGGTPQPAAKLGQARDPFDPRRCGEH
jgi:hypothetical protein